MPGAGFLPDQLENVGLYIPTTDVYEINQILNADINLQELKLLMVRLYQNLNSIALATNLKDSGMYVKNQFVNGQVFFPLQGILLGSTDGAGNASGTVPGNYYALGQYFIIGAERDIVSSSSAGAQPMTSTGPSVTHTFNIGTGAYNFVGAPVNTAIFFFPGGFNPQEEYRNVYRIVVDMGALAAGANTVAHGLTIQSTWQFTRIYGTATNYVAGAATGDYYPLPWASAGGATNIELKVNNQNVVITNNSGVTFAKCYVILEWLKT